MNDFDLLQVQADDELFSDNWKKIEDTLIERNFRDGVLIVDNMYTSTDKEIQNNSEMSALLKEIFRIKKLYGLTMLLIAHPNKGVNIEKDLSVDQIQGGKTLTNSVSNVMQLHTSSTSVDLRVMKITKAGRTEHNDLHNIPFKLKWDDSTCTFEKGAIIKNIAVHFEGVTERWEIKLLKDVYKDDEMQHIQSFNREKFRDKMLDEMNETKLSRLLIRLESWGYIKKIAHNEYQFVRDELDDLI
jgi:RecA-family ATPase